MKLPPLLLSLFFAAATASAQTNPPPSTTPTNSAVSVGAGSYLSAWDSRIDAAIPDNRDVQATQHITDNIAGHPIPTNSWWSSLVWEGTNLPWLGWGSRGSHNVSYAHPFALKAERNGMRLYSPRIEDYWSADYAFVGTMPAPVEEWINGTPTPLHHTVYFKDLDFVLGNSAANDNFVTRVHDYSDWFITARMEASGASMDLTFGHGSPYVFAVYNSGNPTLEFSTDSTAPDAASAAEIWSGSENSRVIGFSVEGRNYAAFAPEGTTWSGLGTSTITANLPSGKKYFSVAALPNRAALAYMEDYAYNHITGTQVSWNYRNSDSKVLTTFNITTQDYPESNASGTLFGLYPHQWRNLSASASLTGDTYFTPRGTMKLAEGESFTTAVTFHGVIPILPELESSADKTRLAGLVNNVRSESFTHRDTYYTGKRLGKIATLVSLAQQSGNTAAETQFLNELKWRIEGWLKADVIDDLEPSPFAKNLFYYNSNWGTMLGIDGSFGSLTQLNDHHFHYGYFVRAAAEIARNDHEWSDQQAFGGMVELLIRDYGNWERPRDSATSARGKMFPFLRNFDIYAGHSWASGHARFGAGNNNESSSEAMNAWTAMILWGEETGNTALRDAGIYLYTTEMTAIQEYWNNVHEDNYHPNYDKPMASLVWGGKTDYATWFSGLPEAMHGIILLPIQSGSLYLGLFPDNVQKNYEFLANGRTQFAMWDAIFYAYQGIYDPAGALTNFNNNEGRMSGSVSGPSSFTEEGNSLANTFTWIKTFEQFGAIDKSVVAENHATYAVFIKGDTRTYVVYNADISNSKNVEFNDGMVVNVGPGEMEVMSQSGVSTPSSSSSSVASSTASSISSESVSSSSVANPSSSSSVSSASSSDSSSSFSSIGTPSDIGVVDITPLANGSVQFSIRLPEEKDQVHLFARRNGQQDYDVIDVQTKAGAEINNGDGTFTYQITRANVYDVGDLVEARFYTYKPASGQIFYPGPAEASWSSMTYSEGTSVSSSSVATSSSAASSTSSATAGYSAAATLPNGATVAYTTTASYANGSVTITFTTEENLNWAWCFTPGWNDMARTSGNSFEVVIPNQQVGSTLTYYFTVNTATRGEGNNVSAPHSWVIQ